MAKDEEESSVGVLGWLGFVIINLAAWGIIGVSSSIAWPFGFGICLVYTIVLVALAICLEKRAEKFTAFRNILWVLACIFLFMCGAYIAINVVGKMDEPDSHLPGGIPPGPPDYFNNDDLGQYLPKDSSDDLKNWADDSSQNSLPEFATMNGTVFFRASLAKCSEVLHESNGAVSKTVEIEDDDRPDRQDADDCQSKLTYAESFTNFKSKLYFFARTSSTGRELWSISKTGAKAHALKETIPGGRDGNAHSLKVDGSRLYYKASYTCEDGHYKQTILYTDGSGNGTVDLRAGDCPVPKPDDNDNDTSDTNRYDRYLPKAGAWGLLFLATIPMLGLASYVLVAKKMPGMALILFGGIWICVSIIRVLFEFYVYGGSDGSAFFDFQKVFASIYTSVCYIGLIVLTARVKDPEKWLAQFRTWAAFVVSCAFFWTVHVVLEVPIANDNWRWVVYVILIVFQAIASLLTARSAPMVFAAIGMLEVAAKTSYEAVNLFSLTGEFATLAMLALFALQGIAIILGAIGYANKKAQIEGSVREILAGNPNVAPLLMAEDPA